MSTPSSAITGENEPKVPHLEIGHDEVRQSVTEVMSTPETTAMARACTAASAFVLSYLARTPLGYAEDPKTIGEKALGVVEKIPGVGGVIEAGKTTKTAWDFISGSWEKIISIHPPATALLAWASAMAIMGMTLNIKDKNPKWKTWGASILITRLAIGAIEQWGNEPLNWTAGITTVGAATVMTGMAIHKKEWWSNLTKAMGSGMGAAWEFLNRDIMPNSVARDREEQRNSGTRRRQPTRKPGTRTRQREESETTRSDNTPPTECSACGSHDLEAWFCCNCGVDHSQPATQEAPTTRTPGGRPGRRLNR